MTGSRPCGTGTESLDDDEPDFDDAFALDEGDDEGDGLGGGVVLTEITRNGKEGER